MAREILFKAWHKEYKYIARVASIDFNTGIVNLNGADICKLDDVILMQYTELNDMSEKKIFDGDKLDYMDDIYIVEWYCDMYIARASGEDIDENADEWVPLSVLSDLAEVVGNVHDETEGKK